MMHMAFEILGISGAPSHDPTAISALNVWDDMLCCMKSTSWRPSENAHSTSVEAAAKGISILRDICCECDSKAYQEWRGNQIRSETGLGMCSPGGTSVS